MNPLDRFDRFTIEPHEDEFCVVGHGTYERSSVLAGQDRRTIVDFFATVEEAQAEHPKAEVLDHSTKVFRGNSLGEISGMSDCAPSWFDPSDAGECWHEDDY
jgi:hypothetical protein